MVAAHHDSVLAGDIILHQFWKSERIPLLLAHSHQMEHIVFNHFQANHSRTPEWRFVVSLPKLTTANQLSESRTQAVQSLSPLKSHCMPNGNSSSLKRWKVGDEHFLLKQSSPSWPPYMKYSTCPCPCMHALRKESSTTIKVYAVPLMPLQRSPLEFLSMTYCLLGLRYTPSCWCTHTHRNCRWCQSHVLSHSWKELKEISITLSGVTILKLPSKIIK